MTPDNDEYVPLLRAQLKDVPPPLLIGDDRYGWVERSPSNSRQQAIAAREAGNAGAFYLVSSGVAATLAYFCFWPVLTTTIAVVSVIYAAVLYYYAIKGWYVPGATLPTQFLAQAGEHPLLPDEYEDTCLTPPGSDVEQGAFSSLAGADHSSSAGTTKSLGPS